MNHGTTSEITAIKRRLGNGLRVVAARMPHLHSVEVAVYIKAGGRNDPPGKAGVSHFLEHMLFRGTREYPTTLDLERAFEALGGSANAATDAESTCYYSRIHPDFTAQGIALFASMLLRPLLNGMEIEKKIICEEALDDLNEQGEEINTDNLASALLWPGHPLGLPTIGSLDSIKSFTPDDLRRHLEDFYVPENAVVAVAGDLDPEAIFRACEEAFGGWSGGIPAAAALPPSIQAVPQSCFVDDSSSQVDLQVAFRSFSFRDRRVPAVRLIRRILCGGGSSRLHLALRERLGIVYAVDAACSFYEDTGSFSIDLSTAPENLVSAVREILDQVRRLAEEGIDGEELGGVRQTYLFDLDYSRDSNYDMQVRYGWGELMGLVKSIEEDRREAERITGKEIGEVASELFAAENLNLVAVGPVKPSVRREIEGMLTGYSLKKSR